MRKFPLPSDRSGTETTSPICVLIRTSGEVQRRARRLHRPDIDGSYASPPSSPGGSMHGCHCSSSTWASQNHLLHVVQRTVAG
jgi:hypothetical protein